MKSRISLRERVRPSRFFRINADASMSWIMRNSALIGNSAWMWQDTTEAIAIRGQFTSSNPRPASSGRPPPPGGEREIMVANGAARHFADEGRRFREGNPRGAVAEPCRSRGSRRSAYHQDDSSLPRSARPVLNDTTTGGWANAAVL